MSKVANCFLVRDGKDCKFDVSFHIEAYVLLAVKKIRRRARNDYNPMQGAIILQMEEILQQLLTNDNKKASVLVTQLDPLTHEFRNFSSLSDGDTPIR